MVWKQAPFNPLRVIKPRDTAITIHGTNRHTGQPVDIYGLTREAEELRAAIVAALPDGPTKRNFAVDRRINHSTNPSAALSDHARGEALDFMVTNYGGRPGITAEGRAYGDRLVAWLDAQMVGPVGLGLRGKRYIGPFRISYYVWNGTIREAGKARRPLKPTSNQHRDHVHISIVPVDRRTTSKPVTDPRRTLKRGATGEDVQMVQRVVGVRADGQFGPITEAAVKKFQTANGLPPTGVVDAATWAEIDEVDEA